jgi:hypothetical protein
VPASAACVALLAAGCGGSSGSSEHARPQIRPRRTYTYVSTSPSTTATVPATAKPPAPSPAAIEHAASLTATKPGFDATIGARIKVPQLGGPILATGHGYFDPGSDSGTLNVAVELPGLLSLAGPVPTQVVLVGDDAYVQVPSSLADELSTPDTWLEASTTQLGLGSSLSPTNILQGIARDATADVPDQSARVTIDPSTGLVRTIELTYSQPGGYHVSVTLRFIGFGPEPASQAPPASAVGDLAATLEQLGF